MKPIVTRIAKLMAKPVAILVPIFKRFRTYATITKNLDLSNRQAAKNAKKT
ncbi:MULTISPECIES: hypothetical protein [Cyanophyceae]|uniref:hypothetical protein n=1 Tax=Cyanophyceae TaxID=3028117 RepID=UPI00232E8CA4|nr:MULTISPECIES: hypothetical protein [Cyanophyceae]MDB9358068.1 hypothetical protein [Nodularia spumigena CS-587/03]MDB9304153.1 hypothetical protein [Nodularia spumigena CS-591/12]MDB9316858.1 hypothetical protein [Nodularia spumigena CS-590/01A]MDB9327485.1 hypothetical protein [Nodularia spumigena CS-590/02]MDB9335322.1 hypothetical protein [Nodularia spumigena CS-590/01]